MRNHKGEFIFAFKHKLQNVSATEAEIWAILHGLSIAWRKGFRNLLIESDSCIAINLLRDGVEAAHPLHDQIRSVLGIGNNTLSIIWRKVNRSANRVADKLAKESLSMTEQCIVLDSLPANLCNVFNLDLTGIASGTVCSVCFLGLEPLCSPKKKKAVEVIIWAMPMGVGYIYKN